MRDFCFRFGKIGYGFITKSGIRYAKLSYLKKKYKAILKDKEEEYRWDKTKEALQRIRIYERLYK